MDGRYILVTAVKNEGGNLSNLIQSVTEQTIKPTLWAIADDNSTDTTPEIIKETKEKYEWIQSIRLAESTKTGWDALHLSSVLMRITEFAIEFSQKNKIEYDYIGNVDGDMILEQTFFEKLINEFEKDPDLGVAGGGTQYIKGDDTTQPSIREDEPSGGDMLIRRECFEDCGGMQLSCCWDSVLKAKTRLRGWKTKRFEYIKATETRIPGSDNYWERGIRIGESAYHLNMHPLHVMIRCLKVSCQKPYYWGIAFVLGYIVSLIGRKEQIEDDEVKRYFRNKWRGYIK